MWTESKMPKSHADVQDLPPGYRMTELGPLPKEWRVVRLGEVTRHQKNTINPQAYPDELFEYYSIPAYQISGEPVLERGGKIHSQKVIVKRGMILFGKLNPRVPKIWHVESGSSRRKIASTEFISLAPLESITSKFLLYLSWSSHVLPKSQELVSGSTPSRQRIDVRAFLNIFVPLPPLPEQRAIAHVLRTVQEAKEATERVIAAARELKKSLMRHLFTYGPVPLDATNNVPLRETEIGPVPAHWQVVRLGDVAEKPQYGYTASATPEPVGPKFLRITDIQNDKVYWPTVPYCSIEEASLERYQLEKGDILFARIGATTGKTYLVDECPLSVFASYLIRVRTKTNYLLSEHLYFFTHTVQYWQQINAAKGGRLKQGINIPILMSLLLPLPPLDEQREIARILQTVDRKIEAEEARKEALDGLFKSLLHHLMTAKLRLPPEFVASFDVPHACEGETS